MMHEEQSQQVTGAPMEPPTNHGEVPPKGVVAAHAQAKSKGQNNTVGAGMTPEKLSISVNQANTKMSENMNRIEELKTGRGWGVTCS